MISGVRASSIRIESTSSTGRSGGPAGPAGLGPGHVVAQVVEPELVVGAVGDVGEVRLALVVRVCCGVDDADLSPRNSVDRPIHSASRLARYSLTVTTWTPSPGQGVEVDRHRRGEGLALTGLHLGDVAAVQREAAEDLDVVGPLVQHPPGSLADDREGLDRRSSRSRRRRGAS
jgi:hypothetical protein